MLIDFLLCQECTIHPWVREAEGADVYAAPETRKCRIQRGMHLRHTFINPDGVLDQVEARALMFCGGEKFPMRTKVECDGETYIAIDVQEARGFAADHLEVLLQ